MATLAAVTHHATSHYSPTETNLDLPEVTTATRDAAPSTHKNPESGIYYCEGIVDEQPVKAIEDSDTLGPIARRRKSNTYHRRTGEKSMEPKK